MSMIFFLSPSSMERVAIYFVIFLSVNDYQYEDDDDKTKTTTNTASSSSPSSLPSLVSLLTDPSFSSSFFDYVDWFMDLEDDWPEDLGDDVIIAPFHPNWEFGADDSDDDMDDDQEEAAASSLNYEKRSPYPLVSLVSTRVVENAGEAVTNTIGEHNRDVLLSIEAQTQTKRGNNDKNTTTDINGRNKHENKNLSVAELWRSALYGRR